MDKEKENEKLIHGMSKRINKRKQTNRRADMPTKYGAPVYNAHPPKTPSFPFSPL